MITTRVQLLQERGYRDKAGHLGSRIRHVGLLYSLGRREAHLHEGVVVDLDPAGTVIVVALEGLCERLDDHTCAYEAVESDAWRGSRRS